MSLEDK